MTVCSYYLRGACKYGDRCRNEHPGATGNFGNQTWSSNNNRVAVPYATETMTADVTPLKEKPLWPLSSYGPAKFEPVLINGLDESPEELHLKAVTAIKAGTTEEYIKYEREKTTTADQVYMNARNNIKQLYEHALKASAQAQSAGSTTSSLASAPTTSAPSSFGTSSVPSAFGKPAFGQAAFGHTGLGGSPSGTSAFGTGTQRTSAFGTPTQPTSAFGQASQPTSAFGQTAPTTSAFGQTSQPNPIFGQPSAFGATSQPTSALAQPSTQTSPTFGKPSQPAPSSLIKPGSGAFGGAGAGGFSAFASQPSSFTPAAAVSGSASGTTPGQSAFGVALSEPKSAFGASQPSPLGVPPFSNTLSVPMAQVSPASAVGGGSPFATSPMTVTPSSEKSASGAPDFTSAKSTARMKPGADRYLGLFPRDYNEMIPADVKAAFASARFEWGKIPDWIPPEEVR
ncbi:hypothetical protein JVU11DRAFT_2100 [Chiua virens]|nr:hypothetical protein JVU11DRAFT_2100 [Chiua virens]